MATSQDVVRLNIYKPNPLTISEFSCLFSFIFHTFLFIFSSSLLSQGLGFPSGPFRHVPSLGSRPHENTEAAICEEKGRVHRALFTRVSSINEACVVLNRKKKKVSQHTYKRVVATGRQHYEKHGLWDSLT